MAFMLMLVMVLSCGSAASVFATTLHESETNDVTAYLTKNYTMPAGVTKPAASFNFTYTMDGVVTGASAYNSSVSADATQPALTALDGTDDITYSAGGTKTGTVGGKDVYVASTGNIVPAASAFSHAGEYVYTIREASATNSSIDSAMTYSAAEYKMHVFVKNYNGGLLVSGVAVYQTRNDSGATGTNQKVDLDNNSFLPNNGNEFEFTNMYAPGDESLIITKTVSGDYADMTKVFNMAVTLNNPSTVSSTSYKGVVVGADNKPVTGDLISFTAGSATSVSLTTGQKLVFVGNDYSPSVNTAVTDADRNVMPAGLTYSVVESAVTDYTPHAVVTHGGVSDGQLTGTAGSDFTVNTNTIVDAGSNIAALESTYHEVAVTGLFIRFLPAVLLIGMCLIGFLVVVISARRRSC